MKTANLKNDELERKIIKKYQLKDKKKRRKMKVSGAHVKELLKIIKQKNKI